ncbi:MAG: heme-binding protein, partial [Verrucomicrobiota bacterium]
AMATAEDSKKDSGHPDPKQLSFTKWTPDFQVPDPVALSFDSKGRAYVTQTQRRKANDLDIRLNMDWLIDDLRFTSTEDKENFYREQFIPENSAANAGRVEDFTGDGIHDIKDLMALTERVHLIADEDGDGLADTIHVYAEQLDHVIGGVAGGVLFHDGDVYVSPVPEVVKFRDTDGDDKADAREVIASGFGTHLAYAGHDMHGLFLGPDGRVYWSIGDKGIRVKTADGLDYRFPSQGGLMRCELDGSNFEIYAHGQRNIQEVSFDRYGNFFGVDNDADYAGEKERLVYIEQYLDSGWRSNWQYLRDDYNPWNDDLMHVPYFEGQPRWFTPPLSNYENGPAGFKYNPGTALGSEYEEYFFLTSAPRGEQWAFQVKPKGDAFEMVNDHKIGEGVALVGLNFAPDGALYGVDWGGGYPLNQKGAVWRIDVPEEKAHPDRENTQGFLEADFSDKDLEEIVNLCSLFLRHADQRVRLKAQFELAKRGATKELQAFALDTDYEQIGRIHAIWGLGQLIRAEKADESTLVGLFSDADPEIRTQAIKTVTDPYGR